MSILGALMKIYLVLTGTTGFPLLESSIIDLAKLDSSLHFILQTKNKISSTKNLTHIEFIDLNSYDTSVLAGIIGHCGAGTTFWALNQKLPYLAVIDLTRTDDHQKDLGYWLRDHQYAYVVESRSLILSDIEELNGQSYKEYQKEAFEIKNLLRLL